MERLRFQEAIAAEEETTVAYNKFDGVPTISRHVGAEIIQICADRIDHCRNVPQSDCLSPIGTSQEHPFPNWINALALVSLAG